MEVIEKQKLLLQQKLAIFVAQLALEDALCSLLCSTGGLLCEAAPEIIWKCLLWKQPFTSKISGGILYMKWCLLTFETKLVPTLRKWKMHGFIYAWLMGFKSWFEIQTSSEVFNS